MLREIRIHNFAIIEALELHFKEGLTILTGETGAGKSILVDAVELLVGGRAAADQIRSGSNEAVLEAAFSDLPGHPLTERIKEMGLTTDSDDALVVRRIIARSGKGRIYLNGGLIPLSLLQPLGEALVDIHGQHEHQSLLKLDRQLELLDAYGKLLPLREEYHRHYRRFLSLKSEKEELLSIERDRARQEDLLRFQQKEIAAAQLKPGEEEALEQEKRLLSHSERLTALSTEAHDLLYEAEGSILGRMSRVQSLVSDLSRIDPRWSEAVELSAGAETNLKEVAERLRRYRDQVEYDPKRLEEIEDRLHQIGNLKKKYGSSIEEVLAYLNKVEKELEALSGSEERLQAVEKELQEEEARARELADRLTKERKRAASAMARELEKELKALRMERTRFEARIQPLNDDGGLGPTGADHVDFMISPNPGEELRLLGRIASGGELSRVMLALKVILNDVDRIPILIFDEVDAGIGGAVAEVVGQRLKTLSRKRQVFCITHLPQIAAHAATHIVIEKRVEGGRTVTQATPLSDSERVEEIARMLGGQKITPTTRKHAQEMLGL